MTDGDMTLHLLSIAAYRQRWAKQGCLFSEGYTWGLKHALAALGWSNGTINAMIANADFCFQEST